MKINRKIFLTLTLLAISYWFIFDFLRWIEFDTAGYIGGARLLFNLEGALNIQSRISKPLVLILPGLSELLFGLHPKYVFLLQNLTCFYLCGFLMYRILLLITKEEKLSYLGMCAYVLCQPFAVYSLFVQVDVVGWFFELSGIYLTLRYVFYSKKIEFKKIALTSFICGAGCLVKESSVMAFIFLMFGILMNSKESSKISLLVAAVAGFLLPVISVQLITDHYFNASIVKRVIEEQKAEGLVYYNKRNFQQLFRIIDMYWFLFIIGLINIAGYIKKYNCSLPVKAMLFSAVAGLLLMPIYPFIVDRILFMVAPFLIPVVIFGADRLMPFRTRLIIIGGASNILICYLIYKYRLHGLLFVGSSIYLITLFLIYRITRKSTKY